MKCGGALERAILYKVLADRLGLPCALHRTTSSYAWCEVAVPEIEPVSHSIYSAYLLIHKCCKIISFLKHEILKIKQECFETFLV